MVLVATTDNQQATPYIVDTRISKLLIWQPFVCKSVQVGNYGIVQGLKRMVHFELVHIVSFDRQRKHNVSRRVAVAAELAEVRCPMSYLGFLSTPLEPRA